MPPLTKMEYRLKRIRLKLNHTPVHPVSFFLAVKINGTTIDSCSGTNFDIAVIVLPVTEGTIAIIIMQGTDQNTITVVKWHKKRFALLNYPLVIEKLQFKLRNNPAEPKENPRREEPFRRLLLFIGKNSFVPFTVVIPEMLPEQLKPMINSADRKFFHSDNETEAAEHAAALIISEAYRAVADHGCFSLVLAGGNSPRLLYEQLARGITTSVLEHYALTVPGGSTDGRESIHLLPRETWLFQGDERCVPFNHPDSNYRMITGTLLKHSGITKDHLLRMVTEHADYELAAREYEAAIRSFFFSDGKLSKQSFPSFDLIILGLGKEGHTASLFAENTDVLHERKRWVVPVNAPQANPPGMRLTLTIPVINHARNVLFYTTGREKYELAGKIFLEEEKGVPASLVNPENGKLFWFAVQP